MCLVVAGAAPANGAEPTNVRESYEKGETLLSLCNKPQDSSLYGFCAGYIIGAADVLDEGSFCPPEGHEKLQVVEITVQWLRDNPQDRSDAAYSLVAQALAESFPCN